MDKFIARENVRHLRRELENGVGEPTRPTMLRLLVEEENHFGHNHEQLGKLDHHISRLRDTHEIPKRPRTQSSLVMRSPVPPGADFRDWYIGDATSPPLDFCY